MGEYLHCVHVAHVARYFCGEYTPTGLIVTPSQDGPSGEHTHWPQELHDHSSFPQTLHNQVERACCDVWPLICKLRQIPQQHRKVRQRQSEVARAKIRVVGHARRPNLCAVRAPCQVLPRYKGCKTSQPRRPPFLACAPLCLPLSVDVGGCNPTGHLLTSDACIAS